ncbi:nuclear transport factor 2 family protein [Nonomuraea sp. NPDC050536]|uniref:nuclear transport factor 2 family protein n=1 Tax=Nonomuraea sp. NPDC050536 TaxID=3364366 RepID=UPI0037C57DC5
MDLDEAQRFAREWAAAWNSHDLDRVLRRYAPDVEFRSPLAAQLVDGSGGVIRGIDALRAYWAEGLRRNPALRFEVTDVYAGIDTVVITYGHQTGRRAAEILTFRDGLVVSGMGTYAA